MRPNPRWMEWRKYLSVAEGPGDTQGSLGASGRWGRRRSGDAEILDLKEERPPTPPEERAAAAAEAALPRELKEGFPRFTAQVKYLIISALSYNSAYEPPYK